jgi:hypothetical protein
VPIATTTCDECRRPIFGQEPVTGDGMRLHPDCWYEIGDMAEPLEPDDAQPGARDE